MNGDILEVKGMNINYMDLFVSGEGGYNSYRIPAIVTSPDGTVLVFCEGRKYSVSDTGDIDILLRRSSDGGKTWEKPLVIADAGKDVFGNPAPVIDKDGTIHLLLTWNLAEKGERFILWESAPRTVWVMKSSDGGKTWTDPREITEYVKDRDWTWYATGPGHGIQLNGGRLVIPSDHGVKLIPGEDFDPNKHYYSHIIYSDDNGLTWHKGGTVPRGGTNECQVCELSDGSLYLSMRNYDGSFRRAYSISKDRGLTWGDVKIDDSLIDPVCQASILSVKEKGIVLFSNPASLKRENLTLKISFDDCKSWNIYKVIYDGPSAYSDLAFLGDTIFCVYENGASSPYERITLAIIE